jgi:hypothetical protein
MLPTKEYTWLKVKYEVENEWKCLYQQNIFIRFLARFTILILWFVDTLFSYLNNKNKATSEVTNFSTAYNKRCFTQKITTLEIRAVVKQ